MLTFPEWIRAERVEVARTSPQKPKGEFVLYVMDASQRTEHNYALEFAISQANVLRKPVLALFPLNEKQPHPNLRKIWFMLQNMIKIKNSLARRNIKLVTCKMIDVADLLTEAALIVIDRAYLPYQTEFRRDLINQATSNVAMVEGDVVCPVKYVSQKAEPYARTIRPKLLKHLFSFLEELPSQTPIVSSLDIKVDGLDYPKVEEYVDSLAIDKSVSVVDRFVGGEDEAQKILHDFVENKLRFYAAGRSDPGVDASTNLSPYLRFGMISPVQILNAVLKVADTGDVNVQSLVNELVVWRELARNAAVYNPRLGVFEGLPLWAKETLDKHAGDRREYEYSLQSLEKAETHDPYWNAAQRELLATGKIHNYMRMYWCKKLIEWTETPQKAFEYAVYLNDRYGLDGVDPNSYLGISWFFGEARKMTVESLRRKP